MKKISKIVFLGSASIMENNLFVSTDNELVEKIIQTNIKNYLKLTKLLLPYMIKTDLSYI